MSDGQFATNIHYKFRYKPFGANAFYRAQLPFITATMTLIQIPAQIGGDVEVVFQYTRTPPNVNPIAGGVAQIQAGVNNWQTGDYISFSMPPGQPGPNGILGETVFCGQITLISQGGNAPGGNPQGVFSINGTANIDPAFVRNILGPATVLSINPGFYDASLWSLNGQPLGTFFPPVDYAPLFRPEPLPADQAE
jgi:hypothetical protein